VDAGADHGDGGGADHGDGDGGAIELPLIERRAGPACEALEGAASVRVDSFHVTSDFFAGCDGTWTEEAIPDRAFTWTAPEGGLYAFEMASSVMWGANLSLGIRRGSCVLTELEGAASPAEAEIICAGSYLTQDGSSPPYQVLPVEAGETLTLVVEGDDYFIDPDPVRKLRQTLTLSVSRVECPNPAVPLPADLPFEIVLRSAVGPSEVLDLSCADTSNTRQHTLAWTAPEAGSYTFEAEPGSASIRSTAIAVLDGACLGDELGCEEAQGLVSASLDLAANQQVVLVVEIDAFSDDDAEVALRVRRN
jgi:hypothetical protein